MTTRIYDSNQVTITIAGILVQSGYAEDEFLTIEQDEEDFQDVVGCDGEVTRSKTNNRAATVKIKLMQSSQGNAQLSALNTLDVTVPGGAGVGPFLVRDRNGTSIYTSTNCWISKPPDVSFAKKAGPREWTIRVDSLVRVDGGN